MRWPAAICSDLRSVNSSLCIGHFCTENANLADAIKADKEQGKTAKPEKKPSIRAQLKADKEKAQKKPQKSKSQDLERS